METYHGLALSPGVAIASAARLADTYGIPQLAPERLRRIGEFLQKAGLDLPEPDQVILLSQNPPLGILGMAMPGIEIVGMVWETDAPTGTAFPCPAVGQMGGDLLTQTEEGEIVIVDGDRGRVYVSPDAQTLARYQGPTRRGRRVFLEPEHLVARRMSNNQAVPVLAVAADFDDVRRAMDAGADGILVPETGAFWTPDAFVSVSEQLARLQSIMEMTSGKLVIIQVPLERVALSALARAASHGPVHLVLESVGLAAEAREELDGIEAELEAEDVSFGRVALEAVLGGDETLTPEALASVRGVLAPGIDTLTELITAAPLAVTAMLSPGDGPAEIARWLELGATRLLTAAEQVQALKDAVRRS